jgi:hypothetical protein
LGGSIATGVAITPSQRSFAISLFFRLFRKPSG